MQHKILCIFPREKYADVPCRCCRWGQSPEALYVIWQRTLLIQPIRGSWRSSRIRRKISFPRTDQSSCEFLLPTCSAPAFHHSSALAEIIVKEQNHIISLIFQLMHTRYIHFLKSIKIYIKNTYKLAPTCFDPIFKTIFRGPVDSTLSRYQVEICWWTLVIELCGVRPYVITIRLYMCLVFLTEWNLVMELWNLNSV